MARYRSFGQLDDPYVEDGDLSFKGLDMHTSPSMLQPGMLSLAENIRINEGVISSRKGATRIWRDAGAHAKSLCKFSDPDGQEQIIVIGRAGIYSTNGTLLSVYSGVPDYSEGAKAQAIQAFDKVIIFTKGSRPRTWTGVTGDPSTELSTVPADSSVDFVCPSAGFGNYISNRLVVPHADDSATTVAFSDIFELNQFDIKNTYFCNKGTSDETIAISPYAENQALILNGRSIHQVNNTHALGASSTNFEITRQYGIAGPKSWVQNGSYIYFVSNEGNIQVLVPSSDPARGLGIAISKITLDQEPLSKPVTPIIDRINIDAIDTCVVHYSKNKVYFALPIDGATQPNVCLVYDSLLSTFISLDTYQNNNFKILDISSVNGEIYFLTEDGLYRYEENELHNDGGYNFVTKFKTRNYLMGSRGIKNFKSGSIGYEHDNGTRLKIDVITVDPDRTIQCRDETATSAETAMSRFNLRQRGYSASVQVTSEYRPSKYNSVHLEASYMSNTVGDFE
jgi:hypothetical protein